MKELSLWGQQEDSVGGSTCHQAWQLKFEHWNLHSAWREFLQGAPPPATHSTWTDECKFKKLKQKSWHFCWNQHAAVTVLARVPCKSSLQSFFSFQGLCGWCFCRSRRDRCWRTVHSWLASFCLGENFLESDYVCSVYLACLSGEPSLVSLVPLSSLKPWKVLCAHLFVCSMLAVRCSFDSSLHDCMLACWLPLDPFGKALVLPAWPGVLLIFWCVKYQRSTGLRMVKDNIFISTVLAACLSSYFPSELKVGQVFLGTFTSFFSSPFLVLS